MALELDTKKKEEFKLDKLKVYVVDCETTGLDGYPQDLVLSIGVSEVDIINQTVDPFYNRVLGYDTNEWDIMKKESWIFENSNLGVEDVLYSYEHGNTAKNVANEFNKAMENKWIAMYNKDYDYGKFLAHSPFNLDPSRILPCLMYASTDPCAIPKSWGHGYKWPALEEAVDILLDDDIKEDLTKQENFHDALFDTFASGHIMLKLIELGHYNIMEYI